MKRSHLTLAAIWSLTALLPAAGWAYGGARLPQGPPPEAYAACEGKSAGEPVEFTSRQGETVSAVCRSVDGRMVALCQERPEGTRDGKTWRLKRMAAALDLTAEQREQMETIFTQEREAALPLREKMAGTRDRLRAAVHAGSSQEEQIRALAAEEAELRADLMVARARAWDRINALLTPEQQKKAAELGPAIGRGGQGGCRNR